VEKTPTLRCGYFLQLQQSLPLQAQLLLTVTHLSLGVALLPLVLHVKAVRLQLLQQQQLTIFLLL